jgi:hypothetical protein
MIQNVFPHLQMLRGLTQSLDLIDYSHSTACESAPVLPDVTSPRLTCLDSTPNQTSNETADDDMIDLELTFQQYEALYEAGLITTTEMKMGRVKRADLDTINAYLKQTDDIGSHKTGHTKAADDKDVIDESDASLTVDCGLKRVDSKRYRRDYVVNRGLQDGKPSDSHQTDRRSSLTSNNRHSYSQVCHRSVHFKSETACRDAFNTVICAQNFAE